MVWYGMMELFSFGKKGCLLINWVDLLGCWAVDWIVSAGKTGERVPEHEEMEWGIA